MAVLPILTGDHPLLRRQAKKVGKVDRSIQTLLDDMLETMRVAPGIGLAANQVGRLLRLISIEVEDTAYQLVNPELIRSEGEVIIEEGCLSLPGYYADVQRAAKVSVKALTRNGKPIKINADGMLARVLQHEIDHLNGVLFIDHLKNLSELRYVSPEEEPAELKV
ncbi:MAG: peptide deformylase [Chloroflexota bacterium]